MSVKYKKNGTWYDISSSSNNAVDAVENGNMNPVTSNAVYDALSNLIVTENVTGTGITVGTNPVRWDVSATKPGYKPIAYTIKGNNSSDITWGVEDDILGNGIFSCGGYARSNSFSGTLTPVASVTWMKI